jgi:nitroimidazol reductase NimA-like FMN-containing flavoprotein (pyridoxamine 5'-phosphate oxidase superfamily)
MKEIRRKEKEIKDKKLMIKILQETKYITIAMCKENIPYLVTLSHGYDIEGNVIYFHCAKNGKKIDILKKNNIIWGQAILDKGYQNGKCDQLYATTQFYGKVSFIDDINEKKHALITMIEQLEQQPEKVIKKQITKQSLNRVNIGRINIEYMTGKTSEEIIINT